MTIDRDGKATLSSGRTFHVYRGIVGLSEEALTDAFSLAFFEGADGLIYTTEQDWMIDPEPAWTADERKELGDYMIGLWTRFIAGGASEQQP